MFDLRDEVLELQELEVEFAEIESFKSSSTPILITSSACGWSTLSSNC